MRAAKVKKQPMLAQLVQYFGGCRSHEFCYSIWELRFDLGTAGRTSFVIRFGAEILFDLLWELQVAQVILFDLGADQVDNSGSTLAPLA